MGVHFAQPQWIHLLWAVLALVGLLAWLERRSASALADFVAAPLQARLLAGPTAAQRGMRIALFGLAAALLTAALMRPQWGTRVIATPRVGTEIMVLLDVSRSMLAEDVAPNRLERAKAEIRDLLGYLDGDQVGLIAFAGRAAVLSPLTPDFGFLRLALEEASPASVGRGGTRLEEPIRMAVAGFGDEGNVNRSILLVTDGEDHDSYPHQAAAAAAERGIRILAIGFGDESGAEILVTDPLTGARTRILDPEGRPVTSRLDGELLRELALATGGAYVPAGTGVLDLEAIFTRHIAPLTRGRLDGRTRTVRNDAYQWPILAAMLCLLGAVSSTASGSRRAAGAAGIPAVVLAALLASAPDASAAPAPGLYGEASPPTSTESPAPVTLDAPTDTPPDTRPGALPGALPGTAARPVPAMPEDPRAAYNAGAAALARDDPEAAMPLLEAARERAGTDAEVRYRATYNLGWASVRAADKLLETAPGDALRQLERAAGWFRAALDIRPSGDDARYNFEIVSRRIMALADALAANDESELVDAIGRLIKGWRGFLAALGPRVTTDAAGSGPDEAERRAFGKLTAGVLGWLGDAERIGRQAARESKSLGGKAAEERSPEERLRLAQLEAVIAHLHRARERMGQSRTQLRRLHGQRAYRRAAAALGSLRRARDQLLGPVDRLDRLLVEGRELAALTAAAVPDASAAGTPARPEWLSAAYLSESHAGIAERTGELHRLLDAARAAPKAPLGPTPDTADPDAARLAAASPLVEQAGTAFDQSAVALADERIDDGLAASREAVDLLAGARELLLDLRRLVELTYTEERRVASLLDPLAGPPAPDAPPLERAAGIQLENLQRGTRLGELISDRLARLASQPEDGTPGVPPRGENNAAERGRLEAAYGAWRNAQSAMHEASGALATATGERESGAAAPAPARAWPPVERAIEELETLRRLFFGLLEHLRETARRQALLGDETEELAVLGPAPGHPADDALATGPLAARQRALAGIAEEIGRGLAEETGAEQTGAGRATDRAEAAALVAAAASEMTQAADTLAASSQELAPARSAQDRASNRLHEAIAKLEEPRDGKDESGGDEQAKSEPGTGKQDQEPSPEPGSSRDLAQLLQGVRDREAQRRRERAERSVRHGYVPVEKDW